jgi:hypothetical protein
VAATAGIQRPTQSLGVNSITWGLAFFDANLDGWEDLYAASGPIWTDDVLPNQLFVNAGGGRFLDLSAPSGAADPGISRGVALADYDRDGLMDVFVVNQDGAPHLYRNVTPVDGRHWLELDTVGTTSNRDGCGALVTVVAGGATLLRQVLCGSTGLSSGSDPALHLALGSASRATRIVVQWPSGTRQVLRGVRADRLVTITEPVR